MKKIGIITIIDNDNYGNRLQNYSTHKLLKDIGFYPITIKNVNCLNNRCSGIKYIKRIIGFKIRSIKKSWNLRKSKRYKNFKEFNKNINFTKKVNSIFNISKNNCTYYIVGSDQVWKPTYGRLSDVDLLSFCDMEKRVSISASFGIDKLAKDAEYKVKKEISKFKAISVREDAGKKIIEDLTDREDIEVLVDPTMMLTSEEWDKVSKIPSMLNKNKYILNYFLGTLSEEREKEIERIAKENNCEIINILDKHSPFYECGPSEFLYLEKNAFLICTDSFHASVFSILYNRPFIIFEREDNRVNMNSRLETLIFKFKLKDRKYEGHITDKNLNHDYSEAYKILEIERKKFKNFLEKSLDIK